jgi:carboxypeptidase Q
MVDTRTYFDYHHSAADTLDKIQPDNIRRQVAVLAVMAFYLADMPDALPRLPPSAKP